MLKRIQAKYWGKQGGFTLIEMLVVIANIAILATIVIVGVNSAREKANVLVTGVQQRELTKVIELYYDDMGFYPPDVNRGWDPGFNQPLPANPDIEAGDTVPAPYNTSGANCSHCPSNWQTLVQQRWNGPYNPGWPRETRWKGKYDYNYWPNGATRSGCVVPPGIYVGVQGNYQNQNMISTDSEQKMIEKKYDSEECLNQESQMLLRTLP